MLQIVPSHLKRLALQNPRSLLDSVFKTQGLDKRAAQPQTVNQNIKHQER